MLLRPDCSCLGWFVLTSKMVPRFVTIRTLGPGSKVTTAISWWQYIIYCISNTQIAEDAMWTWKPHMIPHPRNLRASRIHCFENFWNNIFPRFFPRKIRSHFCQAKGDGYRWSQITYILARSLSFPNVPKFLHYGKIIGCCGRIPNVQYYREGQKVSNRYRAHLFMDSSAARMEAEWTSTKIAFNSKEKKIDGVSLKNLTHVLFCKYKLKFHSRVSAPS